MESLVPAINNSDTEIREYVLSQCTREDYKMGYSIRTKRLRYTEWISKTKQSKE